MLDVSNALDNYSYVGYMQPLSEVTPSRLISEKLLPRQLTPTVVLPQYFRERPVPARTASGRRRGLGVNLELVLQGAIG